MTAVPAWLGATAGQPTLAGSVNQFLGTHTSQYLYAGALQASQTTVGSISVNTVGQWLAQSFTTGASQTTVGYVTVPLRTATTSGSSLPPTTLSIYANSGGAPTGSPLISVTVTAEYAFNASLSTLAIYPLPLTGLTASTEYWLVTPSAGTSGNHFNWYKSNQTSGASLSTNGTSWTAQTYGFLYAIYDQTASGLMTATWEDSGARWTVLTYNSLSQISTLAEYTVGQTTAGYTQGLRTLSYSNAQLTKAV